VLTADNDESLRWTLATACNVAHQRIDADADRPLRKIALLALPAFQPMAAEIGFARDQYDFMFSVKSIGPDVDPEAVAPQRWYVSAND
jgi:hypothetical protein